jgi:hypothetical protein
VWEELSFRNDSPPGPPASLRSAFSSGYAPGEHLHLCTGPLYHAAPLAFSLAALAITGCGDPLSGTWTQSDAATAMRPARRVVEVLASPDIGVTLPRTRSELGERHPMVHLVRNDDYSKCAATLAKLRSMFCWCRLG